MSQPVVIKEEVYQEIQDALKDLGELSFSDPADIEIEQDRTASSLLTAFDKVLKGEFWGFAPSLLQVVEALHDAMEMPPQIVQFAEAVEAEVMDSYGCDEIDCEDLPYLTKAIAEWLQKLEEDERILIE